MTNNTLGQALYDSIMADIIPIYETEKPDWRDETPAKSIMLQIMRREPEFKSLDIKFCRDVSRLEAISQIFYKARAIMDDLRKKHVPDNYDCKGEIELAWSMGYLTLEDVEKSIKDLFNPAEQSGQGETL